MRIASALNNDSLYRRTREKRPEPSPYRRLLRLIFALVLVLAVMKQAGKPQVYRIFFSEPAKRLDEERKAVERSLAEFADSSDPEAFALSATPLTKTIAAISDERRTQLAAALAARATGATADPGSAELANALRIAATDAGESLQSPPAESLLASAVDSMRLQVALDDFYLAKTNDGATWKATDDDAFYRSLQSPTPIGSGARSVKLASVISLLQQPDVYRLRPVSVSGRVARVNRQTSKQNVFGVADYWEVWLQPRDGSDRPVAFYTATLPVEISTFDGAPYVNDGPVIDVEGTYLKRIAFRSQRGSELAPAIVGRVTSTPSPLGLTSATLAIEPANETVPWPWLIAAIVFGIATAAAIMVSTRLANRKLRDARRRHAKQIDISI